MPSITTWTRLEPRARAEDMTAGLEARVHDPVWLLARQWQLGELTGEDAASPAYVRLVADAAPVTTLRVPGGPPRPLPPGVPLETLVERERGPDPALDPALSARAGLHLLRMLEARAGLPPLRAAILRDFPLSPPPAAMAALDAASRRSVEVLARRAPDGAALAAALKDVGDGAPLPPAFVTGAAHEAAVRAVAKAWVEWLGTLFSRPAWDDDPWDPRRMEYAFSVSAPAPVPVALEAAEYHGGRLDWYDFEIPDGGAAALEGPEVETVDVRVLPSPAAYPGMPVNRWWEFEDARTDFGRVEAAPGDLSRALVAEYAMVYSNDWFLAPVELPVGSVCRVRALLVFDVFGEVTRVEEAGSGLADPSGFRLFQPTRTADGGAESVLFVAPVLPAELQGPPVEEVRFLRDEMANLAWAVEAVVESRTGRPLDRHAAWAESRASLPEPAPPPVPAGTLVYRVSNEPSIPEHWFALNPEEIAPGSMRLRLLARDRPGRDGGVETVLPTGRVLGEREALTIFEEEVPREGVRVQRAWQHARGADGSTHVWIGRRKTVGRGEGSSGLVFDTIEPAGAAG